MTEAIGWASSVVLVLTIAKQVYKQWRSRSSDGVSIWLFIGQTAASTGFVIYSWRVKNWVFVATNAVMLISAVVGYVVLLHNRSRARSSGEGRPPSSNGFVFQESKR